MASKFREVIAMSFMPLSRDNDSLRVRRLLVVLLFLLASTLTSPWPLAEAQTTQFSCGVILHGMQQFDLDKDGITDLTILEAKFSSDHDRVLVYDTADNMAFGDSWSDVTDFEDDIWIFDAGADGKANLIVVFTRHGNKHVAYLYTDQDGDKLVSYTIVNKKQVLVREPGYWAAQVTADGSWYNSDGTINRNVTILVDGPIGERGMDYDFVLGMEVNDGRPDVCMECHTGAWAHMSAYCLTQVFVQVSGAIGRTKIRVAEYPLPEIRGYVFWPHLGPGLETPRWPEGIPPALKMDWPAARLASKLGIHNLVMPDLPEVGWWVFSPDAVVKGQDNVLSFENPFAHYDLAEDRDGWSELVVRHTYQPPGTFTYPVGDRYKISTDPQNACQLVRYTWDQDNDNYHDYKLSLLGRNILNANVSFPDFDLATVPYNTLPQTITQRMRWDVIMFVAAEDSQEASAEGIYDWDSPGLSVLAFIFGVGDILKLPMPDIRAGFRGEYQFQASTGPRLYLSPLDHMLHLLGAQRGVWNLNDAHKLRYSDLDGDGYFDQWLLIQGEEPSGPARSTPDYEPFDRSAEGEQIIKSLQIASGFLIYSHINHVRLVQAPGSRNLFEALPPRNHEEWLALGAQLERHRKDFAPDDFLGMMEQFEGPTTAIEGARMEDFRLTDGGFRFALYLQPGFRVLADDNGLKLAALAAGSYLVSYDGAFHVQPLTQPTITLLPEDLSCDPPAPQQLQWATVRAVLRNSGLRDCQSLPIRLYAAHEGGKPLLLAEERVAVPGEGEYVWEHRWPPVLPGRWAVWVEADAAEAMPGETEVGPMARLELDVAPAPMPQMFAPREAYDGVRFTWPVALLLGSVSLAAIAVLGLILSTKGEENSHQRMSNE